MTVVSRRLLRSRRGIALLGLVILAELTTGIGTWSARRGQSAEAASRGRSGAGDVQSLGPPATDEQTTVPESSTSAGPSVAAAGQAPTTAKRRVQSSSTTPPPPAPPRGVRVTPGPGSVTISWDPVPGVVRLYVIRATDADAGFSGTLYACATCTGATFRSLTNGRRYSFTVAAQNEGGEGPQVRSTTVSPVSGLCPTGPCVAVDALVPQGPALLRAQGATHGITNGTDQRRLVPLHLRSWRGSGGLANYALVAQTRASTTQMISDYWFKDNRDPRGGGVPPWENWGRYRSYVTNLVQTARSQGWAPTWWDVQDEPDYGLPYPPGVAVTIQNILDIYKNGFEAIKAADPNAKVIGPTLMGFLPERDPRNPKLLDLTTFLQYAAANNLHFDGLVWHETGAGHLNPYDWTTESIVNHVDAIRAMLSQWPSLGQPAILLNEYVQYRALTTPGWNAGYIAALERAGVDEANTTCFAGDPVADCFSGTLDGMLGSDRTTPRPLYWVHVAYAEMTGTRVDVTSSVPYLSGFATSGGGGGPWKVLLGRHQSCTAGPNPRCDQPSSATPGPTPLTVAVNVGGPDRTLQAVVEHIPDVNSTMPAREMGAAQPVPVHGGVARVPIASFADGEAYVVTLR
jgi:hypothetical protein